MGRRRKADPPGSPRASSRPCQGPPAGLVKGLQQALKKGLQQALKKGTVPHRCPLVEVAMESKVQS